MKKFILGRDHDTSRFVCSKVYKVNKKFFINSDLFWYLCSIAVDFTTIFVTYKKEN